MHMQRDINLWAQTGFVKITLFTKCFLYGVSDILYAQGELTIQKNELKLKSLATEPKVCSLSDC